MAWSHLLSKMADAPLSNKIGRSGAEWVVDLARRATNASIVENIPRIIESAMHAGPHNLKDRLRAFIMRGTWPDGCRTMHMAERAHNAIRAQRPTIRELLCPRIPHKGLTREAPCHPQTV